MIVALLLAAQAPTTLTADISPVRQRYDHCLELAAKDPPAAEKEASSWMLGGGTFLAHQCLGLSYTARSRWSAGAAEFEIAARGADVARDDRAAYFWAQAGNAWLAAKDASRARADLDAALSPHTLVGLQSGEAYLDRARAYVAIGDMAAARADLDHAVVEADRDPLAWLLSATLARRTGDLPRAKKDIAEALGRASDDASVQLEAGNIAAKDGDEAGAKAAWDRAAALQPGSPANKSAIAALAQFDAPAKP
jgi:tetratricopeptide (TPR) repeat protein